MQTGINYFANYLGVSQGLQIFYDFKESGVNPIPSVSLGNPIYSGIITGNLNNFYSTTGSGLFGNNLIQISNASGLNSNDWTMGINFQIITGQNSIIFSSYSSGAPNSGFLIGVNNSAAPYVEYFTSTGPTILQSQNNWSSKNSIFITKTANHLTLDYLNFNTKTLESEQFSVQDNYFLFSDRWILGGGSGMPSYFSGNNFNGYIDNFLFFTPSLLPYQRLGIFSGIFCDISQPAQNVTSGITNIITGYSTGIVPIFSGTTGQASEFFTYLTGACNSVTAQYVVNNLTGFVYDFQNVPLVQQIVNYFTGITGGGALENSGYSKSFGMDGISYLKDVNSGDLSEFFYFPTTNKFNINNDLVFDRILNKFILPTTVTTDQINFYIDSVAQLGSGYSAGGTYYNPTVNISGMYFISGNYISGSYDGNDTNIVDFISGGRANSTGNFWIINQTTGISGLALNNSSVFLNGIKLISGIDFLNSGNNFILQNNLFYGITGGQYWTFPHDSDSKFSSGIYNNFIFNQQSARGTTINYLNGTREFIGEDFIEISKFSPLNNKSNFLSNFLQNLNQIYINDNSFIENLKSI